MNASHHSLIVRGLLAAGFLAACAVAAGGDDSAAGKTAQESKSLPTPEEQQKAFAAMLEKMKDPETGRSQNYFSKFGTPAALPFAREVLAFVRDKAGDDAWEGGRARDAAISLGRMGARELADDLLSALPEVKAETRYGIMMALEQFGDQRSVEAAKMVLSADGVLDFNAHNIKGGHWGATPPIQDEAIRLLVRYRSPGLEEEVTKMLTLEVPQARLGAIRCLREMGATGRAGDIAKLIGPDQPPGIRSYAILTLGDFRAAAFLPDIAAVLEQKRDDIEDGWPELKVVWGGGHLNRLSMLERPEFPVSAAAIKVLAGMGARQYIPQMAGALHAVPGPTFEDVLRILVDLKAREAGPQIAAMLDGQVGEGVRTSVVQALRQLRAVDQAPQVAQLLLPEEKGGPNYSSDWYREDTGVVVIGALEELSPALLRESIPGVLRTQGLPLTKSRVLAALRNMDAAPFAEDVRKLTLPAEPAGLRMEAGCLLWEQKLMSDTDALVGVARCLARGMTREELVDKRNHPWPLEIAPRLASPLLSHAEDDVVRGTLLLLTFAKVEPPPDALTALLAPSRSQELKEAALDAMTATVALNESQLNTVATIAGSDPALAARACEVLLRNHAVSQTPLLLVLLSHSDTRVSDAAQRTLLQLGGTLPEQELYTLMERACRHPEQRAPARFAANFFLERDVALRPAIPFLVERDPFLPKDPAEARAALTALSAFCTGADAQKHERTLQVTAIAMAKIVREVVWDFSDAPFLQSMADRLSAKDLSEKSAFSTATIRAVAKEMAAQHPLRRAARVLLWIITAQFSLWLVILTLYPWSRLARCMVWNHWTRRGLGFGWVGPVLLRARWLRERIWLPFREALVPPGEVVSFDEWTFFDAVRVSPFRGGEAQPALRVLEAQRGVTVLYGVSGLGKTTLLQSLAGRSSRPVALLRAAECGAGLLEALRARLPHQARGDASFLQALAVRGSPDILVDAVHEALPEVRAKLSAEIESLPGANILLTTQPAEWTPPAGAAEWQLEPLRTQDIAPFLLKQGTAAAEAAGAGSLAERQRAFAARTAAFLDELEKLPPESERAVSLRRMLGNPMEAVLAAELLAAGQTLDPDRLLEQRMEHLTEDYATEHGGEFPAPAFADHLRTWRASGAPLLRLDLFAGVASFLARHRLLRKIAGGSEAWRFRHDKIMEWFLRAPAAEGNSGKHN